MPILKPLHRRFFIVFLAVAIVCGCAARSHDGSNPKTLAQDLSQNANALDRSVKWFDAANPGHINGVALVIHGLNLRPDKMVALISTLTTSGVAVLNLSLRGHGKNHEVDSRLSSSQARMKAFKTVSHSVWFQEAHHAYLYAKQRSNEQNVPLFLVAFSYGALLGSDLFASRPNVRFDKMALFAPAFTITMGYGLKWLSPFPRLVIPSYSSTSYRANAGTPMAAYNTLFSTITHFKTHLGPQLNVPTIIFIDPKDELISLRGLKRMIQAERLTRWKLHRLQKGPVGVKTGLHHLIIDEDSLGPKVWDEVRNRMVRHLLSLN